MNINDRAWRKSSYSGDAPTSDCVEVAPLTDSTGIRDSKARLRGHIVAPTGAWTTFLSMLRK